MSSTELPPSTKDVDANTQPRKLKPAENPQTLAREGYNASAQTYLDWTSTKPDFRIKWLSKLFMRFQNDNPVPLSDARCLELGCGAGVPATLKLAQTCAYVTGVEISSAQIELARSAFAKANISDTKYEFLESDMMGVSFSDGSFDIVCAFYSIIHVPLDDQREVLARIFKWLVPGGYLLFNASKIASLEGGTVLEGWLGMTAYWASFGEEKTLEVVKGTGFDILEYQVEEAEGDALFTFIIAKKPTR